MGFFRVLTQDENTLARLGILETPHGIVETPAYVIVATHGRVRCLSAKDIPLTQTQLLIANTYHLWRSLDEAELSSFVGLHETMGWAGPLMTDSGGFQVFSLGVLRERGLRRSNEKEKNGKDKNVNLVRVTESGVYFRPDGAMSEELYLDAETSVRIQEQLGADIIVALDEPTSPWHNYDYTKQSLERTHRWAARSLEARESRQYMYGVVQGGVFENLRRRSARVIGGLDFDGFAIGGTYGNAYGGTKAQTATMLRWTVAELPPAKPRHLFGVGAIDDLLAGVAAGIDTFDCIIPTREARHGRIWTRHGYFNITRSIYKHDSAPLMADCACAVCTDASSRRRDIHQLFKAKDVSAGRLVTIHNIFFFNALLAEIRSAIAVGNFAQFRGEYLTELQREADITGGIGYNKLDELA